MYLATPITATADRLNELQMESLRNIANLMTPSGSKRNVAAIEAAQTPKSKGRPKKIKKVFPGKRPDSSASSNDGENNISYEENGVKQLDTSNEFIPGPPGYGPPGFELPVEHQIITNENEVQLTPRFAVPTKRGPGRPRKSLDPSSEPKKPMERTRPPSERIEVELTFCFLDFFNKIIFLSPLFLLNKSMLQKLEKDKEVERKEEEARLMNAKLKAMEEENAEWKAALPNSELELAKICNNYLVRHPQPTAKPPPLKRPIDFNLNCHRNKNTTYKCASKEARHAAPYYDSGDFSYLCPKCRAKLLRNEFQLLCQKCWAKCCAYGDVDTELMRAEYKVCTSPISIRK